MLQAIAVSTLMVVGAALVPYRLSSPETRTGGLAIPRVVEAVECSAGACDAPWPFVKCCVSKQWNYHTWCHGGGCGDSSCDDES